MVRARFLPLIVLLACQTRGPQPVSAEPRDESASARLTPAEGTIGATAAPSAERGRIAKSEHTLRFDSTPFGRVDVVVRVPEHDREGELPLLVAFHGRGETLKGPKLGARGWLDDYRLERSIAALSDPPLESKDFLGSVSQKRLEAINAGLSAAPFRDVVVVMPYLPDVLKGEHAFRNGPELAKLLVDEILPRVAREVPVRTSAERVGIDGVSLGGRAALLIGFSRPEVFRTLGATQPAVDATELERLVAMARSARSRKPGLALRLLTSEEDYYKDVVSAFSTELRSAGVTHVFDVVQGDHSYDFNRGPGGIEMMLYHSAELWRPLAASPRP